jgi:hypothetical protein
VVRKADQSPLLKCEGYVQYTDRFTVYMTDLPRWAHRTIESDILPQRSRYTMKSRCVYPHVAMIFKGRKLIAIGQNRIYCHGPFSMIHAECDVLRSVKNLSLLRDATLVVIRLGPRGLLNSAPCAPCIMVMQKYIKEYGMRGYIHS